MDGMLQRPDHNSINLARARLQNRLTLLSMVLAVAALGAPAAGQGGDQPTRSAPRANDPVRIGRAAIESRVDDVARNAGERAEVVPMFPGRRGSDAGAAPAPDVDVPVGTSTVVREAAPLGLPERSFGSRSDRSEGDGAGGDAPSSSVGELVRIGGGLAIVIGLIFVTRLAVRRMAPTMGTAGRPSGVLEVLARYPVGRGQHLVVLKLARRILLVHQAGTSMTTLSEISEPDEVAQVLGRLEAGANRATKAGFNAMLKRFEHDHEAPRTPRSNVSGRGAAAVQDSTPVFGGEIVDLTQPSTNGLRRMLARRTA
jgi:flagellar biogenesis protein FliO